MSTRVGAACLSRLHYFRVLLFGISFCYTCRCSVCRCVPPESFIPTRPKAFRPPKNPGETVCHAATFVMLTSAEDDKPRSLARDLRRPAVFWPDSIVRHGCRCSSSFTGVGLGRPGAPAENTPSARRGTVPAVPRPPVGKGAGRAEGRSWHRFQSG